MSEAEETASLRRGIRLDLVIAVCALLMSAAATGASWWQSRVVADQLSAQVWPYISISTTYERGGVAVDVLNNGLGPAIIRSTVLSVCSCSLLGKCWQTAMQQSADPVPIRQCPSVGEAQYKVPVVIKS